MKHGLLLVPILVLIALVAGMNYDTSTQSFEIDDVKVVVHVVDGDTFDVYPYRVRIADIDAPELNEPGGHEAKEALKELILNETVYLDIDDLGSPRDPYNRIIAVVYKRYNSTHLLNVNK